MAINSSNSKEKSCNLSNYLQERIVERAAYEVDSKEGWLLILKREYLAADQNQGNQVLTAGKQLHLEVKAGEG